MLKRTVNNLNKGVVIKAKMWQMVIVVSIILTALLVMGSAKPQPEFKAMTASLDPIASLEAESKPVEPVVIRRVVRVDSPSSPVPAPSAAPAQPVGDSGGSGFIMAGNNCVACVMAMTGRGQNGNAGTWVPSHSTPRVGDIMIFYPGEQGSGSLGHVGVVKGIQGGQIQLAHCNWGGGQTVFASTGKFF